MQNRPVYTVVAIVDITRSMNVADYRIDDQNVSRLAFARQKLRELLIRLPCQSKMGVGVFTERRSLLLFEPLEVCSAGAELDAVLSHLDWRMSWAADSNVGRGLLDALTLLRDEDSVLLFLTDGHEAPPLNPNYRVDFSAVKGRHGGLLVGLGDLTPKPIPKFDEEGRAVGFYKPEDVPHRSTFGEPPDDASRVEGYHARNAPFGNRRVEAVEHLSALHESHLRDLAQETGLHYSRLTGRTDLAEELRDRNLGRLRQVPTALSRYYALAALLLIGAVYRPDFMRTGFFRSNLFRSNLTLKIRGLVGALWLRIKMHYFKN